MADPLAMTPDEVELERKCNVVNAVTGEAIPVGSLIGVATSSGTYNVITHDSLQLGNCNQFKGSILCVDSNNFICETRSEKEHNVKATRSWSKQKGEKKQNVSVSNAIDDVEQRDGDGNNAGATSAEWYESAQMPVLSVRCKNTNAELHKSKFGSGGRGRCIKLDDVWYTPSEFEAFCGRASSKDWKRSIRFGGRSILALIDCGILEPHATACTCSACCDDDTATGPVRLFTPYKRRRRNIELEGATKKSKSNHDSDEAEDAADKMTVSDWRQDVKVTEWHTEQSYVQVKGQLNEDLVDEPLDVVQEEVQPETKTIYTVTEAPQKSVPLPPQLKKLDEMAEKMIRMACHFKQTVAELKASWNDVDVRSGNSREKEEAMLNSHMETVTYDTREEILPVHVVNTVETMSLQPTTDISENKKCANCDRDAFAECSMCRRTPYCSTFCQRKDWSVHQVECVRDQPGSIMLIVESADHVPQIMPHK